MVTQFYRRLSLASRFGLAMAVVLVLAGLGIGAFVTGRIEEAVVRNTANATAIYMESIVAPISQQLADSDTLSPGAARALEEIFANTPLGRRVVSYKFWREDGLLIHASNRAIVGQTFDLTDDLRRAWDGEVMADFDDLGDAEDAAEAALGLPMLEIYSPIREVWSGKVIAVAEFYEINEELRAALNAARLGAWAIVGGTVATIGLVLYAIVLGGSRTIDSQRRALDARLAELRDLSDRNQDLRLRVQAAAGRAAQQAEETMRRIGADLHDGPAQDLAYAALRLDSLAGQLEDHASAPDLAQIRDAITQAMGEVRSLSRGLSLPRLAGLPLPAILAQAAEAHEVRTGHAVRFSAQGDLAGDPGDPLRIAAFRFVQEGLNNASRHGGGEDLSVDLRMQDGRLTLTVADRGPGLADPAGQATRGEPDRPGLGLTGLRDRVESLGAGFVARTRDGGGTELIMTLDTGRSA